jgi:hypothetical protein
LSAYAPGGRWLAERPRTVLLAALACCAIAIVVGVLASTGGSAQPAGAAPATTSVSHIGPTGMNATALRAYVATTLKQPVWWAGPRKGYVYELTRSTNGSIYIRYLPPGARVGDPAANYLLVATYPYADAFTRLENVAGGAGRTLTDGAFVLPDSASPRSVHLAFPQSNYEIEVYDPSPAVAQRVAGSGAVQPVR